MIVGFLTALAYLAVAIIYFLQYRRLVNHTVSESSEWWRLEILTPLFLAVLASISTLVSASSDFMFVLAGLSWFLLIIVAVVTLSNEKHLLTEFLGTSKFEIPISRGALVFIMGQVVILLCAIADIWAKSG